ncbi:site-specific integrase [Mesorhizobium amorphae]|uniref:site-specific integrase n=1 Tax=Mesorhizobium amorphae TaxID=71433 RepID=UPI0021B26CF5|nr:site-specific integrase [Mesorhizobium amorphae]
MKKVKEATGADVEFATFHTFCHTWATWMRRYAGLDTRGLVGTGRWRDEKSAARYEHVVASEESKRADLLPTPRQPRKAKSVETAWKPNLKAVK